ncbi:MAG TPA: rRNA maturation RNase YbeY [Candidatus Binataceae bacterium]|nr:rRNA maturation RNase YbeY [Candidatus Binataceae bacterium]
MPVEVRCESAGAYRYVKRLRAAALALLQANALEACELSLMIVDDRGIRALNREFRHKDRATDVLAFPQFEAIVPGATPSGAAARSAPPLPIGDVVISLDTARRQAAASGIKPPERLQALLVHGFLHLLGYDHERSAADARKMFARERELLAYLESRRPASSPVRRRSRR